MVKQTACCETKMLYNLQRKISNTLLIVTVNHILEKYTYIFQSFQCFFLLTLKYSYRSAISNTQRLELSYH